MHNAFNPSFDAARASVRSSGLLCGAPRDLSPDVEPGKWSESPSWRIDLMYMFLVVGDTGAPRGNLCRHQDNMQTPNRKTSEARGIKPRTFLLRSMSANHCTTLLLKSFCQNQTKHKGSEKESFHFIDFQALLPSIEEGRSGFSWQ